MQGKEGNKNGKAEKSVEMFGSYNNGIFADKNEMTFSPLRTLRSQR